MSTYKTQPDAMGGEHLANDDSILPAQFFN